MKLTLEMDIPNEEIMTQDEVEAKAYESFIQCSMVEHMQEALKARREGHEGLVTQHALWANAIHNATFKIEKTK